MKLTPQNRSKIFFNNNKNIEARGTKCKHTQKLNSRKIMQGKTDNKVDQTS